MVQAKTTVPKAKVKTVTSANIKVPVDIIFIVDVTGSMGGYIRAAKQFLTNSMLEITAISPLLDNAYSLIVYRDHPPEDSSFASKVLTNCGDTSDLNSGMAHHYFKADGGGDTPESGLDAIKDISKLNLRTGSVRYAFIIGDAPLHGTGKAAGASEKCKCGMTSALARSVLECYNTELIGVNISRSSIATTSFATVASKVIQVSDTNGVNAISEALSVLCKNVVWAVSTVLPILKKDKYKPLADIAMQCESTIAEVSAAIETLNQLELTATL